MLFTLRIAEPRDIPGMAAIRAAEWETQAYWEQRISGYLAGTHNPQRALPERAAFVAEDGGAVAGFVAGHRTRRFDCDGELEWINVAATHRGQGIAGQLFAPMAAWFLEQQAWRVCVNVTPENTAARALYGRLGAVSFKEYWMVWPDIRASLPRGR